VEQGAATPARSRRRPRTVLLLALVVLLALLVWGAARAWTARAAAHEATAALAEAQKSLRAGDLVGAVGSAERAAQATRRGRDAADALPLVLAQAVPVLGRDVRAVRTTLAATDDAVADAVLPVAQAASETLTAQQQAPAGQVDLAALADLSDALDRAAGVVARSSDDVGRIDAGGLVLVGEHVQDAATRLADLDRTMTSAGTALGAAVPALGADGPRSYLIAAQNLAESRPTGGLIGSWALLTVDQGRFTLESTGANDDLATLTGRLRDLPPDVEALYGQDLALSQNLNLSPDFPQAATLLVDLWTAQGRPAPDGVIGPDPVAPARMLAATGPVPPPVGPVLDRRNLVRVVQQDVYSTYEGRNAERLAYLGSVTATVVDALVGADWSTPELRRSLTRSLQDGHLVLWSADPATQDTLVNLGAAGALGAPDEAGGAVRVHLTNVDASKLDQFLDVAAAATCSGTSPQVALQLTSTPPRRLPDYSRSHLDGLAPLDHRLLVALYLPPTRGVAGLEVDGAVRRMSAGTEQGWTVVRSVVDVPAGATVRLTWTLSGDERVPRLHLQPLTRDPDVTSAAAGDDCS